MPSNREKLRRIREKIEYPEADENYEQKLISDPRKENSGSFKFDKYDSYFDQV